MANKVVITDIAQKQTDGTLGAQSTIGADFASVIDGRANSDGHSLQQFYDSYMDFMKNGYFIASGTTQPANNHVAL